MEMVTVLFFGDRWSGMALCPFLYARIIHPEKRCNFLLRPGVRHVMQCEHMETSGNKRAVVTVVLPRDLVRWVDRRAREAMTSRSHIIRTDLRDLREQAKQTKRRVKL